MPTIRELRKQKHLSQARLATLADVSYTSVSRIERGIAIHENNFNRICKALGISPESVEEYRVLRGSRS